ncbi:1-aminocyclopropane-1-carboxylate deaminase/D-cysteine desulfhydrase [Thalassotalea marina]|uniref:1-aminocyclopropane-1-carboxylate deaminase n=1 Tax=Thalassotalea marina TaxID=1673741 RepID=A0A919BE36_9GAMM|nr:pyridoxal-phosphate dependent enzyme [Thalassotalea marina]GHF82733.1 1-aminocyclopropane-1-carboxylate deaminase [Thalassotalea marina]
MTLSPVEQLNSPLFNKHDVSVFVKRDDLIHPIISGNKWRKLQYNLAEAKKLGYKGVISFGGAYSNHLHALAFACHQQGLTAKLIIRGEPSYAQNYTLRCAKHWGAHLLFVDRATYRRRTDPEFRAQLSNDYPELMLIPEGGTNSLALRGVREVMTELETQQTFDTIMTPVGSAGTLSGLICGAKGQQVLGVAVLKQAQYLVDEIQSLLKTQKCSYNNWQLLTDYHQGGYAKFSQQDLTRIQNFMKETGLPLEPIYSGKMICAFLTLLEQGFFNKGHRIMLLHTGGLQGLYGLAEQNRIKADEWPLPHEIPAR